MPVTRFAYTLLALCIVLAIGTLGYHALEGWGYTDSLYFSVATVSTVGFGDFHPTTYVSKLFTIGYLLVGVLTFLATAGSLSVLLLGYETRTLHAVLRSLGVDRHPKARRRR